MAFSVLLAVKNVWDMLLLVSFNQASLFLFTFCSTTVSTSFFGDKKLGVESIETFSYEKKTVAGFSIGENFQFNFQSHNVKHLRGV